MIGLVLVVCGIFVLLGQGWVRWLALVWMAGHVVISFFGSRQQVIVHFLLFAMITYGLFREDARTYFRQQKGGA